MNTSDGADAKSPSAAGPDRHAWRPGDALEPLEHRMVRAAAAGELLQAGEDRTDAASTTIRAAVLQHLLIEETWPVSPKGVRLRGLRIDGLLDLEGATVRCPLRLEGCSCGGPVAVNLDYATVSLLALIGCTLPGLSGDTLKVTDSLHLSTSTLTGPLMLQGAQIGGNLVCRSTRFDGAGLALCGETIKIDGNVILDGAVTSAGGINLRGADIGGALQCTGAKLGGAVKLPDGTLCSVLADWMKVGGPVRLDGGFTAAHTVLLLGASIAANLNCRDAVLNGGPVALEAELLTVGGNLLADRMEATAGGIDLRGADIGGALQFTKAKLEGAFNAPDGTPCALFAEWIKVGGPVRLNEGFVAAHTVWLLGAGIAANLNCRRAVLDGGKTALQAERMSVGGNVLAEGLSATARAADSTAINLVCADIKGNLKCTEAHLSGTSSAVHAERLNVGGDVFFGSTRFTGGGIELPDAHVSGNVDLGGARINSPIRAVFANRLRVDGDVLFQSTVICGTVQLTGAGITGALHWAPAEPIGGDVMLGDAQVGHLRDNWTLPNGSWPAGGRLRLHGFTYGSLAADRPVEVRARLEWIRSQWPRDEVNAFWRDILISVLKMLRAHKPQEPDRPGGAAEFDTQPYEQLANVYRQSGQDSEARAVAIARRRDARRYQKLTPWRLALNWLLDKTIRYGYQTLRAVVALACVFAVAIVVFSIAAQHANVIVPLTQTASGHRPPPVTRCTSNYPCFYPVGYAIDTVIPIINVHQATYWGPDGHTSLGHLLVIFTWLCTALGWALATLAVAGYTGLVRNADAG